MIARCVKGCGVAVLYCGMVAQARCALSPMQYLGGCDDTVKFVKQRLGQAKRTLPTVRFVQSRTACNG